MALATYADLKNSIEDWLQRADLDNYLADFIVMFEASANRRLRVRQMETTASLTPSSGEATIPSDYLAWKRVTWTGSTRIELEYVHPSYLQGAYPSTPSGTPSVFTIEGSTLKIRPTDGTALEFEYYQKIPALSSAVNWLYQAHPDLYLYGSLVEAQSFLNKEDDLSKVAMWKARRDELFEEIIRLNRHTMAPSSIRVQGYVP